MIIKCEMCKCLFDRKLSEIKRSLAKNNFCSHQCYRYFGRCSDRGLPPLTERQIEIIIGSLLGDATISKPKTEYQNAKFSKIQKIGRIDYIDWSAKELEPYSCNISFGKSGKPCRDKNTGVITYSTEIFCESCTAYTHSHPIFTNMRHHWYPNGPKIVPRDIKLTPLTVAIWFCDDGTNTPQNRSAKFSTDGFTFEDTNILVSKLYDLNIKTTVVKHVGKPVVQVSAKSYIDFIEMIKPYVIWDSMAYKVDLSKYISPHPTTSQVAGVDLKKDGSWQARKQVNGIRRNLGRYKTEKEAIQAVALGVVLESNIPSIAWTESEIAVIVEHGKYKMACELLELLPGRTKESVLTQRKRLGIKFTQYTRAGRFARSHVCK